MRPSGESGADGASPRALTSSDSRTSAGGRGTESSRCCGGRLEKRVRRKLGEIKIELKRRMHVPVPVVGKWLGAVVRGHFNYYGVPTNYSALSTFRFHVAWLWWRTLRRRSHKTRVTWGRMCHLVAAYLPPARITHPQPGVRFGLTT
jgi:hypothetical protein